MPTNSKEPSGPDLGALLEGLIEADIKFILVGGLAAVIQGAPVTTMDVDIVHSQSPENISKDPNNKQRLPVLKETLRQLKKT